MIIKQITTVVSMSIFLLLTGCASSGNQKLADQSTANLEQSLVIGKTTKAYVIALLGDPNSKSINSNGEENDVYSFGHAHAGAAGYIPIFGLLAKPNVESKVLGVLYTPAGVLKTYTVNESQRTSGGDTAESSTIYGKDFRGNPVKITSVRKHTSEGDSASTSTASIDAAGHAVLLVTDNTNGKSIRTVDGVEMLLP